MRPASADGMNLAPSMKRTKARPIVVRPKTNRIAKSCRLMGSSGELARPKIPEPKAPRQLTTIIEAPGWRRCKTIMPAKASVISIDKRLAEETARAESARHHDDDADERRGRGHEGAGRDALAIDEEAHRRGDEGHRRVDHHDVGDGRRHHRGGVGGDRDHREQRHDRRQRAEAERVRRGARSAIRSARRSRSRPRQAAPASPSPSRRRDGREGGRTSPPGST